jgi:hypothetical protein
MNETFYPSSKAKGNQFGRSRKLSNVARLRSHESLNVTLHPCAPAIICPTRPMNGLSVERLAAEPTSGSRMTKSANMSDAGSNMAGLRNSLPVALKECIQSCRSVIKPFTSGSTPMPENLFRHWCEPIVTASEEAIHGVIKKPIFRREYRLKNALKRSCYAKSLGTGKQTRLSRVKVWRPCKSALSARPGSPSSANCSGKELAQ